MGSRRQAGLPDSGPLDSQHFPQALPSATTEQLLAASMENPSQLFLGERWGRGAICVSMLL